MAVEKYVRFQLRDKLFRPRRNYERDVFNGDIGVIEIIDSVEQEVSIRFDHQLVKYFGGATRLSRGIREF